MGIMTVAANYAPHSNAVIVNIKMKSKIMNRERRQKIEPMLDLLQEFTKFLQTKGYIQKETRGYLGDDTPRVNAISEEFLEKQPNWMKVDDVIHILKREMTIHDALVKFNWKTLEHSGMDKKLVMCDPESKEEMLKLVQDERPTQKIYQVIHFEKNKYGFYDVYVNMDSNRKDIVGKTIKNVDFKLPYPIHKFILLSDSEANKWMDE